MNGRQAVLYGEPRSLALGQKRGPRLQERPRLPEDGRPPVELISAECDCYGSCLRWRLHR